MSKSSRTLSSIPEEEPTSPTMIAACTPKKMQKTPTKKISPLKKTPVKQTCPAPPAISSRLTQPTTEAALKISPVYNTDSLPVKLRTMHLIQRELERVNRDRAHVRHEIDIIYTQMRQCEEEMEELELQCKKAGGEAGAGAGAAASATGKTT